MYVELEDMRPRTSLHSQKFDLSSFLGGTIVSTLAHLAVPVLAKTMLSVLVLASSGVDTSYPSIREEHVIEARFVKLGEKRDPRKLPNRRVPIKSTAPDDKVVVSKNMNPEPPKSKPDAGARPSRAEQDLITRLGDRAQAFAEIAERREQEGDPEGVEWGTETEGRAGDIYRGKLYVFFKRGWTVPSTMSSAEIQKLMTKVTVQITPDRLIGSFEIVDGSGQPLFDQSVVDNLRQLRESRAEIPEPPEEVEEQYLGQKITLRFKGSEL
ncbi:MAG: TonB C-terminal domain-containing protein [Deltaproteobacteria bacterium]|nr:TonB C-terminal domain-containing protein [Deltaproteobacteria bacterium]